jgi:hypothetical protein
MLASTLRKLAALLFILVPLIPLAGLFAEQHNCACGMSEDACFCELAAAQPGAHCDMGGSGECSMRPLQVPSGAALFVSFDLRGWLQMRSWQEAGPVVTPAGAVPLFDEHTPRSFSRSPEPPPPRNLRFA